LRRNKKKKYYSTLMENSENIGKDIWRVAKEVLFNRPNSCATFPTTSLQVEGRDVASNDIPDVLNEYYTTIVDEMLTGRETPTKQDTDAYLRKLPQAPDELILYPVTSGKILKYVR